MAFELQFLGGAGTVTGAKYLITYGGKKILVDCGLFQGVKSWRLKNWDDSWVNPSDVDAVVLTHAHIDHSGYIPRLVKNGFKGKVYATFATRDLCKILLPDCGYLLEEEAEYLNRHKRTRHSPALPLFSLKEAEQALNNFVGVPFKQQVDLGSDINFEFLYAGHILGAAAVVFNIAGSRIAFSGDVGRPEDSLYLPPAPLPQVDYLVVESTYGNRLHKTSNPADDLAEIVNEVYAREGVIIIPAFAIGRAQAIMHYLGQLRRQKRIPEFPMFLNSPMAKEFSQLFQKYSYLHKLSEGECKEIGQVLEIVHTTDASKALNERHGPMLIISASGMLTGGRVLHHLKAFGPHAKNLILLTGFQSAGTRGEALQMGAREIKIHGEYVRIRAEVKILDNMSAHADYNEILHWLKPCNLQPKRTFITHGEPAAADELRRRLTDTFKWNCVVPDYKERFNLE